MKGINRDLAHMTDVAVKWFEYVREKYGADHPRQTELKNFDTIEAVKVVEANEKLYINRQEGFIGTALKRDEFVCNCSDIDDIIIFYKDGKYKVVRIADKLFVGKNIVHLQVFKKNDKRTIYNVVYRDGKQGTYFIKRFFVSSITRDREYDVTQGTPGSKIVYMTANPNGEAEVIKAIFDPAANRKRPFVLKDFSEVPIKGRISKGNILSKYPLTRVGLKSHGHSTLGGRKVWYDPDVNRLNYDEHGLLLGEFNEDDSILVVLKNGDFYITNFDVNNHYEDNIERIEKYDKDKVWTAVLFDADNKNQLYAKRFLMEATKRHQNWFSDNPESKLLYLSDRPYPRIRVNFGSNDAFRTPMEIELEQFVGIKGFKAHGKRVTAWNVDYIEELEPTRFPEPPAQEEQPAEEAEAADEETVDIPVSDEPDGEHNEQNTQLSLFPDEE